MIVAPLGDTCLPLLRITSNYWCYTPQQCITAILSLFNTMFELYLSPLHIWDKPWFSSFVVYAKEESIKPSILIASRKVLSLIHRLRICQKRTSSSRRCTMAAWTISSVTLTPTMRTPFINHCRIIKRSIFMKASLYLRGFWGEELTRWPPLLLTVVGCKNLGSRQHGWCVNDIIDRK